MLLEVSGHLFPDHKQLLADCYLSLKETDPAKIENFAGQLDDVLRKDTFGRPGVFGRKLFPDCRIVAESLLLQLRLRAAYRKLSLALRQRHRRRSVSDCYATALTPT